MDIIFKNLFTLQQFSVSTKSLHILFLMLDPTRKLIQDIFEEKKYEEDRIRRHKLRALEKKRLETPRSITYRDQRGIPVDDSFIVSQRTARAKNLINIRKESEPIVMKLDEQLDLKAQLEARATSQEDKITALINKDLPIDEYLLYFSLIKTHYRKIPKDAL